MAGAIRATVHYHGILCCFKLRAHDIRKACMRIYISARVCVWSTVHMDAFDHEERARGRACKHSIAAFSAVRGDVQSPRRPCERERKRERKRPRAFVPSMGDTMSTVGRGSGTGTCDPGVTHSHAGRGV